MLSRDRHHREGRDRADGPVLGPRVEAGVQLPHGRLGRVHRRGVSSPLRSLLATFNRDKGLGAVNWGRYSNAKVDYLIEQALQQVDDENRKVDAAERDQARDGGPRHHADPLPVHDLGDEEERRLHAAHRRVHARVPVQAGEGAKP